MDAWSGLPRSAPAGERSTFFLLGSILVSMLLFGFISPAAAQGIAGIVTEEGTEVAIAQAEVLLLDAEGDTAASTYTDVRGSFRLDAGETGDFTLQVTHLSFAGYTSPVLTLGLRETTVVEIRLTVQAIALEPLNVVGTRYMDNPRLREFYDRADQNRRLGRGRAYFREDLDRMGDLEEIMFDVPVRPSLSVYSRGGCQFDYFIDGQHVFVEGGLDEMGSPLQYEGIEVYWGINVPPEYRRRPQTCGVVLLWNRPGGNPFTWGKLILAGALTGLIMLLY